MRNQGQVFIALVLILLGVMFLLGNLFNIDVGLFCWPMALILLGVWLLLRPRLVAPGTEITQKVLGQIERDGPWQVRDEEFWSFIADMDLNMAKADIPLGETKLRAMGFIGDVELLAPEDIGVAVASNAFISDVKIPGGKEDSFLVPLHWQSDNYKTAERKIYLETTFFIADIKIRQI
jgi:lia operon protein LiaF